MKVKSPAKINLTLDILKKEGDYHLIDTILHEIDLYDELTFRLIPEKKIAIKCNDPRVPTGRTNTCYAAAELLNQSKGIKITIKKNIPVASGLGGGSSNAATTLKVLNKLWKLNLSPEDLQKLASKIGMDVPFFIKGGTARGTRYGEKITQLPRKKLPPHLIVLDSDKTSTKDAYAAIGRTETANQHEPYFNAFDQFINRPLQKKLLQLGADVVHICGSGPALYALFKTENQLEKAFKELKGQVRFIWGSN